MGQYGFPGKDPVVEEDLGLCPEEVPSDWQKMFSFLGLQDFLFKHERWIIK